MTPMTTEDRVKTRSIVLIVDDSVDVLDAAKVILEPNGYSVLQAADPFTGIRMAATHRPDAIVLDLDMPGMDGSEAVRHLKRIQQTSHIPVIAFTGNSVIRPERLTARGFERIVEKADGFDALEQEIEDVLRCRAA